MPEKIEAGSEQWFDVLREVVEEALAGIDLTGVQTGLYEELRDPPKHLLADGETTLTWRVKISEDGVEVGRGRVVNAAAWVEADYQAIQRLAIPHADPQYPEIMRELEAKGMFRRFGDAANLPPHIGAALAGLHDEMVRRTK